MTRAPPGWQWSNTAPPFLYRDDPHSSIVKEGDGRWHVYVETSAYPGDSAWHVLNSAVADAERRRAKAAGIPVREVG